MSTMADTDPWLAAEFALGVLEGKRLLAAHRKFESDPDFEADVLAWHEQFSPFHEEVAAVIPSRKVWERVEEMVFGEVSGADTGDSAPSGLWESLAFWRGASLLTGGLAAAAITVMLYLPPHGLMLEPEVLPPPPHPMVATLTASGEAPAFLAQFDPAENRLVVRVAALEPPPETQVPELWLIPGDGVPRSLGLLDVKAERVIAVSPQMRRLIGEGVALAVSLEPPGGSPTGAPTGPVVASGALQTL